MKVLMTHDRFAPDFGGGGEYVALETAHGLARRGIEVRVLTTGDPSVTEYEGIETIRLPMHRYRFNLAARHIARLARQADLIHTFNYHACLPSLAAGRRLSKPVVCMILGLFGPAWRQMRGPVLGRAWMLWERYLITRPYTRLIFPSAYSREQGLRMGVAPQRTLVNCPGIDADYFGQVGDKQDVILFVGKLDVRKGIDDLLEAARAVPEARFRVMGWGDGEATLRRQAPTNVEFVPFERGRKLREAFAAARIFLLPSRAETFGIAVLEAMASGCAVISTIPLEFEGIRVEPGDRPAIIDAVRRLWADPDLTRQMGLRNAQLAPAYTWDRFLATLTDTYDQILGGQR